MSERDRDAAASEAAGDTHVDAEAPTPADKDFVMTIGVVAQMFRIPTTTLRFYELLGLIARHQAGHNRVYSWSQCERIALIVKSRRAGLRVRDLKPVLVAIDERAAKTVSDAGRRHAVSLINMLEERQQAIGNVLGELYRIDWELCARLGVKDSGGTDDAATSA